MQNIDDKFVNEVSRILYDDFTGGQDSEIPRDEYDPEAKKLLSQLLGVSELSEKTISILLTKVMQDQFGYDFTPHEIQEGAYPKTAQRLLTVINRYK